jgi:hypothetical protein
MRDVATLVQARQKDRELVAPQTGDGVLGANRLLQCARDLRE